MQSDLLADPRRADESSRYRRSARRDFDTRPAGDGRDGNQQFFVEWELAESA